MAKAESRTKRLDLRLTEDEYNLLELNSKRAGMTKTRYFVACLRRSEFIQIDSLELANIYRELAAQGNNLNQATQRLNEAMAFGSASNTDHLAKGLTQIMAMKTEHSKATAELQKLIKKAIGKGE